MPTNVKRTFVKRRTGIDFGELNQFHIYELCEGAAKFNGLGFDKDPEIARAQMAQAWRYQDTRDRAYEFLESRHNDGYMLSRTVPSAAELFGGGREV